MRVRRTALTALFAIALFASPALAEVRYFPVPEGDQPHDVAPAPDGGVWYSGQGAGVLGHLDPKTGRVDRIPLGEGSRPHGVIQGPDGAAWLTDGGQNAIVRVDPKTGKVDRWPLPKDAPDANLNTGVFDPEGQYWFTGQTGFYGRLDPKSGAMKVWTSPRGVGPYGITATPGGEIYYVSLAGSYLARLDKNTGEARVIEPRAPDVGTRRVWSDSKGRLWVSEWNGGFLSVYDPASARWEGYALPGGGGQAYAVFVDDRDKVWLSDFTANAILRFDPESKTFESFPSNRPDANVRQMLGRPGEAWGAESGTDRLVVITSDQSATQ